MVSNVNSVKAAKAAKAAQSAGVKTDKVGNIPIGQITNATNQKYALNAFTTDIKGGKVAYEEPNFLLKLLGAENSFTIQLDDKNQTLGDIKDRYNLNDGEMSQNIRDDYGGNRDKYKVPIDSDGKPFVTIYSKDLSTATGVSEENLKSMATQKKE